MDIPNYQSVDVSLDVETPFEESNYIHTSLITSLTKPFLTRAAWLVTIILSILSIIPLCGKCVLNLLDGFFHRPSFKEAGKNALGILAVPFIVIIAAVSIILPAIISGRFARGLVLPIIPVYSLRNVLPSLHLSVEEVPKENIAKTKGINGMLIDSADIPLTSIPNLQRYRLVFNAAGELYQTFISATKRDNKELRCHSRLFNYPGVTQNNSPGSNLDFVNAGIAEIYDIARKMNWDHKALEKHLHLYGYCFGGAVALQVAAYFREQHQINFLIFIDRSFTSFADAMAGVLYGYTGIPFFLAKSFSSVFLYAGGDLNLDSLSAIKKLDMKNIHYINVGPKTLTSIPESIFTRMKNFLGIGENHAFNDGLLLNTITLTEGLKEKKDHCVECTSYIFKELKINHLVYSNTNRGHFENLRALRTHANPFDNYNAMDYYRSVIRAHDEKKETIPQAIIPTSNQPVPTFAIGQTMASR